MDKIGNESVIQWDRCHKRVINRMLKNVREGIHYSARVAKRSFSGEMEQDSEDD